MFELVATSGSARAGIVTTRRGRVLTPTFMPVATQAHVRHVALADVAASGARICLTNTYHLMQKPFTGLDPSMLWLTDSGGFQIFSLRAQVEEEGARLPQLMLTPEQSIAAQQMIDSDIMMVLDVCLDSTSDEATTRAAMERTHRWAVRSLQARTTDQALFGIVQGGVFPKLRQESAAVLSELPFDGMAIGGLAVGESRDALYETTLFAAPLLPAAKPRYLMGVGTPADLVEAVNAGVDMFDCILPTMMAEQGYAYTFEGPLRLTRAEYRQQNKPLDDCPCPTCMRYSRAELSHTIVPSLIAVHNLFHYQALMRRMRQAIIDGRWPAEYRLLRDTLGPKETRREPGKARGAFELVTTKTGARAVRHREHGEVMHPIGPWQEANALYVDQIDALRVETAVPLRVLDVGLGAGANAVAAMTAAKRPLHITSLEIDLDALRLALTDPEGFAFLTPWRDACEAVLREHAWKDWRVLVGDARETLPPGPFDVVYFDPFSPPTNPTLWTVDFFRRLRAVCSGQLVTYSAATPTRVALLQAGFFVGHGAATGTRGETTIAAVDLALLKQPLGARWLQRWERSTARGNEDIRQHPQFRSRV